MCFFKQLQKACENNGISVTSAVIQLGISRSSVTNWKKGVVPNGDVIVRLSELLSVSTDYLLTGKNSPADYPTNIQQMINDLLLLNERGLDRIRGAMDILLVDNQYIKTTGESLTAG